VLMLSCTANAWLSRGFAVFLLAGALDTCAELPCQCHALLRLMLRPCSERTPLEATQSSSKRLATLDELLLAQPQGRLGSPLSRDCQAAEVSSFGPSAGLASG